MAADADVLIIGAGPAGLTAAYCLTKEARSVIVIEKDPTYVGGISRTVQYKDYLLDIGGHRFSSNAKEVVDLWHEILPDGFIERPQLSRIFYRGKYYSYPLSAFEAFSNLGIFASTGCMLSYAFARLRPIEDPRSFREWARNQFGKKLFRIFFKTYAEKVWGMSCDEISADWAPQRIRDLNLSTTARHAIKHSLRQRAARRDDARMPVETFQYPRKGPGMMWDAAAQKIRARGGQILMGRELSGLSYNEDKGLWRIDVATAQGAESYTTRHVISSAPVRELADKLSQRPVSLLHACALRYRDFITVALMVKKPDLFPDNWIYIHDPSVKVARVQNFRSWSPDLVPHGMNCLGLEYFCFQGDGIWNSADAELIALARSEICKIGLVAADDIVDGCVVRQPKAYPVYDEDYRDNMAMIRLDLETHYPTLHLVGRNGMHRHDNQDQVMMAAFMTVGNILAGSRVHDVWACDENAERQGAGSSDIGAMLPGEPGISPVVAGEQAA
ncbi:MAG: NAD(P)/FAD-dependent oxidoreductase [Xanthobacteraceae bacterium]